MFFKPLIKVAIPFASRFSVDCAVAQQINPSTNTRMNFNIVRYDNNDEYDNVTNFRFTAKEAGLYSIGAFVRIGDINDGKNAYLGIEKNGSLEILSDQKDSNAVEDLDLLGYGDIELAADDYLEVIMWHDDVANKFASISYLCRFWGHRIA